MGVTTYPLNDALAVKRWARELAYEVRKGLEIAPLIGTSKDSIIQEKTELKDTGDKVTVGLRVRLTGEGVTESQVLEGNEETLSTYTDSLIINELAHAVRVKNGNTIDPQRVTFDLRDEAREALRDWYSERLSLAVFLQLCGYTGASITYRGTLVNLSPKYTGLNPVAAPTANRTYRVNAQVSDQALTTADTFGLADITKAKELARTVNPRIRPVKVNGADKYVLYLHPYQVTDLKLEAQGSGAISWSDIQLAALAGGDSSKNPIYTGAIGEYDGVVLRESEDVCTGLHSGTGAEITTVRRAVLLGAQSGLVAFSSKFSKNSPYKWVEKTFDYERELGVSAQGIMGLKKTQFNGEDFGVITISSYAKAHN